MDSVVQILIKRANNEIMTAKAMKTISEDDALKTKLVIPPLETFYSSTISHSYYAIFYAAKSILRTKRIVTISPNIHLKTFNAFKKHFIDSMLLERKLLDAYKYTALGSSELLEIFHYEKGKRGHFTYKSIPQANMKLADESLENAILFVSAIMKYLETI